MLPAPCVLKSTDIPTVEGSCPAEEINRTPQNGSCLLYVGFIPQHPESLAVPHASPLPSPRLLSLPPRSPALDTCTTGQRPCSIRVLTEATRCSAPCYEDLQSHDARSGGLWWLRFGLGHCVVAHATEAVSLCSPSCPSSCRLHAAGLAACTYIVAGKSSAPGTKV